uniref:Uncharacterized protein n=1 Tax=Nucleocytoviricota sp. TaxID=2809609 RepID=A0A9E8JYH7_9VIRU|nr:hypothetical protein [Nucleocytoviricota sp.]UZT29221.1 hypothetical protein [Nucleocytoviricota sp.]
MQGGYKGSFVKVTARDQQKVANHLVKASKELYNTGKELGKLSKTKINYVNKMRRSRKNKKTRKSGKRR